jgi:hypothetical protein
MVANVPWFVSVFLPVDVESMQKRRLLWWVSFVLDFGSLCFSFLMARLLRKWFRFRLALNIEHFVERLGLFTLIVIGEVIVSLLWSSDNPTFSQKYAETLLGLVISISIQWTYFVLLDGHGGKFVHPIRRSLVTGVAWGFGHLPFQASIVVGGVGVGLLIKYDIPTANGSMALVQALAAAAGGDGLGEALKDGLNKYGVTAVRWLLCGGFAVTYACFAAAALMYRSLDRGGLPYFEPPVADPLKSSDADLSASGPRNTDDAQHLSEGFDVSVQDASSSATVLQVETQDQTESSPVSKQSSWWPGFRRRPRTDDRMEEVPRCLQVPFDEKRRRMEEARKRPWMPKLLRVGIRILIVICLLLVGGFGDGLSSIQLLGVVAALLLTQTLMEEVGRFRRE